MKLTKGPFELDYLSLSTRVSFVSLEELMKATFDNFHNLFSAYFL